MSEKDMVDLGLTAMGDRLKLKAFCSRKKNSSEREEKISKIKEILSQGKSKRAKKRDAGNTAKPDNNSGSKRKTTKFETLKFEFGWKHWRTGRGYVQQKKNSGGGTRSFNVPCHSSLKECQDVALNLFFPNGKSHVGAVEDMSIGMGNFTGDFIPSDFTAEKYKAATGFPTPRLYLLTRHEEDAVPSEDELMTSAFDREENHESPPTIPFPGENDGLFGTFDEPQEYSKASPPRNPSLRENGRLSGTTTEGQQNLEGNPPTSLSVGENDALIGTSAERQKYFEDLDRAVKASLEADKEKENRREERKRKLDLHVRVAEEEAARLERLRQSRELRCPLEPSSDEAHVWVSVRHTNLGVVSRAFDPNGTVSGIYDWIGSLCPTPEHFRLIAFPSSTLFPEDRIMTVQNTILNMTVEKEPIPLCRDEDEVYFLDGAGFEGANDETLSDGSEEEARQLPHFPDNQSTYEVEPINNNPPVQLLHDENTNSDTMQSLEDKRVKAYNGLSLPGRIVLINRHDVVNELLSFYKDEGDAILFSKLHMSFIDETGLGDGVLREVFSTFWDSFLSRYGEGNNQFAIVPRPTLTDQDYEALGRMISHQFVLTGTFPIQLAEAQIMHLLFGEVSDECLIKSFLNLLPERECQILCQAQEKDGPFPTDAVVDILCEYNVVSLPTANSLPQIIAQLSRSEMIHKPFFVLGKIRQGMGNFWADITKDEIKDMYRRSTPNCTNVTGSLNWVALDKKEEQVASWLVRYLKAADNKMLWRFVRFCTAGGIMLPNRQISIRLEQMSEAAMRPKALTCMWSLTLPKGYQSFAHLSSNLDYYLTNTSLWNLID